MSIFRNGLNRLRLSWALFTKKNNEEINRQFGIRIRNTDLQNGTFIFPAWLTSVNDRAFHGCTELSTIHVPDHFTAIGDYAFAECKILPRISIPHRVRSIGQSAFYGCAALLSITIPDGVPDIRHNTFSECTALTTVNLPNSITSIWNRVFYRCTSLTTINLPNSVTSIGSSAFNGCISLATINLPDNITSIKHGTFYACRALTTITIPKRVTSIECSAFSQCVKLRHITIPAGIISIHEHAFHDCPNLTSIIIDTEDKVEFERITQLLPQELRGKTTTPSLYYAQHLVLGKFNAEAYPIPRLPTEVRATLFSYDALTSELNFALSTALQNVPMPQPWDDLTDYKRALNNVLEHDWERYKVCVYLDHYKETIKQSAPKHLRFFSDEARTPQSQQNKSIVALCKLIERLVVELTTSDIITLSTEEKALLLARPALMARIPEAIQKQMGVESQANTQNEAGPALVDTPSSENIEPKIGR